MVQNIFSDFARMYPERFTNVTNGITPRRWLAQASPSLSSLIDKRLGPRWRTDLFELGRLREWRDDPEFCKAFHDAKFANKLRLVERAKRDANAIINPEALFDLQVKRIHEYKRQLLNILYVIVRYNRIRENPEKDWTPRVVMFAGKAASAYKMAKNIIKLINDVAKKINADPLIGDRLKVGFIPNYGVSVAELIIPAADLSEQISMAGTEASGTGNMKLALNGALTIGTLDGANIEICDAVGRENIFIFGNTTDEIESLRAAGYRPRQIYEENPELKLALDQIRLGHFAPEEPHRFYDIFHTLVDWGDHYMVLADFDSFDKTQTEVDLKFRDKDAWTKSAIENVAGMGIFSSDRTIAEYARDIWHVETLQVT
jgi:glycogen phosphorylase